MSELSPDFDEYVEELTKQNRIAVALLVAGTVLAALFFMIFIATTYFESPFGFWDEKAMPEVLQWALRGDAINALNFASISANLAVAAAIRIWYTRQDKMTTLLTHAMVIEGENDTAIRVLLNKKSRR